MAAIGADPNARTPSWPSLYNPGLEIIHIEHRHPIQPSGAYLYKPVDIFRFTLFWTLIFYTPLFFVCGTYAFINLSFPPSHHLNHNNNASYPLSALSPVALDVAPLLSRNLHKPPKINARRSRLTFALLVFLAFGALGIAGAVIGSAILGFVMAALYKAARFNMSTWIPLLLAVIQVLLGLLSIWPSVIDII